MNSWKTDTKLAKKGGVPGTLFEIIDLILIFDNFSKFRNKTEFAHFLFDLAQLLIWVWVPAQTTNLYYYGRKNCFVEIENLPGHIFLLLWPNLTNLLPWYKTPISVHRLPWSIEYNCRWCQAWQTQECTHTR